MNKTRFMDRISDRDRILGKTIFADRIVCTGKPMDKTISKNCKAMGKIVDKAMCAGKICFRKKQGEGLYE